MTTPSGMRNRSFTLSSGEQVMVYSNTDQIILQLRREVPTVENILSPSFKVAVAITPSEALSLAAELVSIASSQVKKMASQSEQSN